MHTYFNLYGAVTILISTISCFIAFRAYRSNKASLSLLFLFITGLCLRVYAASDQFIHFWDERYHALVAKHLISNPLTPTLYKNPILPYNLNYWSSCHIWLSKPPMALWFTALSLHFFGINEWAIRTPAIILSTLSILLTFKIATLLFNNKVALLAAFLHAINGMLIEMAGGRLSSDLVETSFLFFFELSVLCLILALQKDKRILWILLAGLTTGLAFLCKWTPALLILPIGIVGILTSAQNKGKRFVYSMVFISAALFISSLWCGYIYLQFPAEAKAMFLSLLHPINHIVQEHDGPFWYYINEIRIIFGEIIYAPLAWFIYRTFKEKKEFAYYLIAIWVLIPLMLFSLAATKRETYILVAAPAFFILIAQAYVYLSAQTYTGYYLMIKRIGLLLLLALPIRYCIERVKPFQAKDTSHQWVEDLKNWHEKNKPNSILLGYKAPIEAMFYTEATVYEQIPEPYIIDSLIRNHYSVFINDNKAVSKAVHHVKGVQLVHLAQPD